MKKNYYLLFGIASFVLLSISPLSKKITAQRNTKREDFIIKDILLDTSLFFDSYLALNKYKEKIKANLVNYTNDVGKTIADADRRKYFSDSLLWENVERENFLLFKTIQRMPKTMSILVSLQQFVVPAKFISMERLLAFFNEFPPSAKSSFEGKKTLSKIMSFIPTTNSNIDKNSMLDNIIFRSLKGDALSARKLITKTKYDYCLVLFGASWCTPCRHENMVLKKIIGRIDTSKVKIVGLSIDTNETSWKNAVKQDDCPWECVLLEGSTASPFFKQHVPASSIPVNMLITKDGSIVTKHSVLEVVLEALPEYVYKKF